MRRNADGEDGTYSSNYTMIQACFVFCTCNHLSFFNLHKAFLYRNFTSKKRNRTDLPTIIVVIKLRIFFELEERFSRND